MKINAATALGTEKLLLVPYEVRHVPTYHEWMKDPDLQAATASEPLSLDEEYDMQRSWRIDHDKLTFIICKPLDHICCKDETIAAGVDDADAKMVGDINLFLSDCEGDDDPSPPAGDAGQQVVGELELMIALQDMQQQGYGRAALLAFIWYILQSWQSIAVEYSDGEGLGAQKAPALAYLRVKINDSNERSIRLFQSLDFEQVGAANYFGEVELRWSPDKIKLQQQQTWEEPKVLKYIETDGEAVQ